MTRRDLPRALLLALALTLGCGDDGSAPPDGGEACTEDGDCDDRVFCNGTERCGAAGLCEAGSDPCGAGAACDEAAGRCATLCSVDADSDGDGVDATECGGTDCDDSDADVYPGATEVCDVAGRDEDCDPTTVGDTDADGDGYVDASCCNGTTCGDDCDDSVATVHPGEAESCDGVDQDCDGTVDEGGSLVFVSDADGDGHGTDEAGAATVMGCDPPAGYAASTDDCDDTNGAIHPGAFDRCDAENVDDDCSGTPNDPPGGCECSSGETRTCPFPGACAASTQLCVAGTWGGCGIGPTEEICGNDIDEDCDGAADDGCTCEETFRVCGSDTGACVRGVQRCTTEGWGPCVDEVSASPEVCNETDDDCDGMTDEGLTRTCWTDADGDGFAVASASPMAICGACPAGTTDREPTGAANQDCADAEDDAFPGQTLYFSRPVGGVGGYDFDCDGALEREPGPTTCETAGDGSCVADRIYLGDTSDCGQNVSTVDCWAPSGSCQAVNGCDVPVGGGGPTCHNLACR